MRDPFDPFEPPAADTATPAADAPEPPPADTSAWPLDWGRLLRTSRQVAGLSLTALSAATGLSKGYLSKLESGAAGAVNPSRATLAALARALPSFRPLAHTLEPGMGTTSLDYRGILPTPAETAPATAPPVRGVPVPDVPAGPIQLGWRELEVLTALVALEAAALPARITAPVLARATGRAPAALLPALKRLVAQGLVVADLPARPGGSAVYRAAEDAAARIGVERLGDLLLLAAALMAAAPVTGAPGATSRPPRRAPGTRGAADAARDEER